jgi:hypothetical protein
MISDHPSRILEKQFPRESEPRSLRVTGSHCRQVAHFGGSSVTVVTVGNVVNRALRHRELALVDRVSSSNVSCGFETRPGMDSETPCKITVTNFKLPRAAVTVTSAGEKKANAS